MSISEVIQWNGPSSVLAWRYPHSEIPVGSQLIVKEHQHAVLLKEGRMIGPFPAGRHTLDTKNIPVLRSFLGSVTSGATPFPAEVWFVNRTVDLNVRWGTSTPIQLKDPTYNIMIPVLGYGMLGVSITDTKKFLLKLVGAMQVYDRETVESHFRAILLSSIKTHIAKALVERKLSILDIAASISELSDDLQKLFAVEFGEFGLSVIAFKIESITTRENDPAVVRLREALARRAELQILGTDFAQAESFEVMKRAASNEGGTAAPIVGAGVGFGIGASIAGQMGGIGANLNTQGPRCGGCGAGLPAGARFCAVCGQSAAPTSGKCRGCGTAMQAGARFCSGCGAACAARCSGCGGELTPEARFCAGCGKPFTGAAS